MSKKNQRKKKRASRRPKPSPLAIFVDGRREQVERLMFDARRNKVEWNIANATVPRAYAYVETLVQRHFVNIQVFDTRGRSWVGSGKLDKVDAVRSKPYRRAVSVTWFGELMPTE